MFAGDFLIIKIRLAGACFAAPIVGSHVLSSLLSREAMQLQFGWDVE